jgi:hypothetical protein
MRNGISGKRQKLMSVNSFVRRDRTLEKRVLGRALDFSAARMSWGRFYKSVWFSIHGQS